MTETDKWTKIDDEHVKKEVTNVTDRIMSKKELLHIKARYEALIADVNKGLDLLPKEELAE